MSPNRLLYKIFLLIKNRNTVPRWIIFFLDLAICAFALIYAFLLRFNMDWTVVEQHGLIIPLATVTGLNILFFRLFRTYEGIIRLSSVNEAMRCVSAVFATSFALFLSIGVSEFFNVLYIIPTSVLFIYFFVASFLIFAYRIWVKELYRRSMNIKFSKESVFVCCRTGAGASLLKNAIESISGRQYKVVGFIEEDPRHWSKAIDNAKIYSFESAKPLLIKLAIEEIFIAENEVDLALKNQIVDFCLLNDISVKVIPAMQKWVDGQLKSRQIKAIKIEDLLNRPSIQLSPAHVVDYLKGKRILITGAAGSIGSEIVKQVAQIDIEQLILCDNRETGLYDLQYQLEQQECNRDKIIVSVSDIRDGDMMDFIFKTYQPEIVFHAAAYKHVPLMEMHPCQAVKNNVKGTKIIADLSVKYGVERFVFISTDKAINPTNVMGASKRIAEMYIAQLNESQKAPSTSLGVEGTGAYFQHGKTKFIATRFGNVLGSNGSVIPRFQNQIDKGGPVTVTHPEITRYFMTIPEACSLVLEAGTMGAGGEIFVFDMGEPVKIYDLARKMIKLAGYIPDKEIHIAYSGLRPGEKLYEELLNKSEKVIPTHNKKIMISKVVNNQTNFIFESIDFLIDLAEDNKVEKVVKQMKSIVPEYISKNSIYQKFDFIENSDQVSISV
ncbi:MAG: nucleoside-diphosphate sugar epimerase/dehydratase [Ginsengibacter sp.]